MSTSAHPGAGDPNVTPDAGPSTDQHVTGSSEQGTFLTGEAPTADTPADGSTNAGINATRANRVTETDRAAQTDEAAQTDQAAPTD